MNRITIDGTNSWFDAEAAIRWENDTTFDGSNFISVMTGCQWSHQSLYYTKSGRWVLHETSAYQGTVDTWEFVEQSDAVAWLLQNDATFKRLPQDVQAEFQTEIDALEV